jgi:hypothetical protein
LPQLANDLVNVNRFEQSQLSEVASRALDLLKDPRGSAFQVVYSPVYLLVVHVTLSLQLFDLCFVAQGAPLHIRGDTRSEHWRTEERGTRSHSFFSRGCKE